LSEETDAIVVAVSEETGAVSYAYKGQFVRGVTLEALRAFLTSVLVSHAKRNWLGWFRTVAKIRVKTATPETMTKTETTQATSTQPAK
jgi:hypothetical protein